jgi:hypothetical protein
MSTAIIMPSWTVTTMPGPRQMSVQEKYLRFVGVSSFSLWRSLTAMGAPATSAAPPTSLAHPRALLDDDWIMIDGRPYFVAGLLLGRGSVRHLPRRDGGRLPHRDDHARQARQPIRPGSTRSVITDTASVLTAAARQHVAETLNAIAWHVSGETWQYEPRPVGGTHEYASCQGQKRMFWAEICELAVGHLCDCHTVPRIIGNYGLVPASPAAELIENLLPAYGPYPADNRFRASYECLEARMKDRAEADGDVFLPNPEPLGPAEYVFVCMEPSLGRWARSPEEAKARIEAGFRNFVSSVEDFILHFCIRQYLCEPAERYHITDLSKGAMLVKRASIDRSPRYDRWYGLLLEELDLVAKPGAGIFAVGNAVAQHLTRRQFPRPITRVIHYSGQAGLARAAAIAGHENDLEKFKNSVSLELLLATAKDVLDKSVPANLRDKTLARLEGSKLSLSRKQLIFTYKVAFEGHR